MSGRSRAQAGLISGPVLLITLLNYCILIFIHSNLSLLKVPQYPMASQTQLVILMLLRPTFSHLFRQHLLSTTLVPITGDTLTIIQAKL